MADENVKIFNAKGEYTMSEEDNFKTAKSIALESAEENLNDEVENFLREKFPTLDDFDIVDIEVKFLKKNEPRFIRENLPNGDMICYAEIQAEISLTDLNNFMKNFDVFKLEKKVDELQNKLELFQECLPDLIKAEIEVKNNPEDEFAYYIRGSIYYKLKNYSQTIEDYTQAIKLDPNFSWVYYNRGVIYAELKNYSQAIEDYTQAIELDPNSGKYYDRGVTYYNLKNYSQAIEDYTQAIKLNPNDAEAYYKRGLCYKALGRNAEAEKDFAKARELGYNG